MSKFSYGELLAIYDGLEKLPKGSILSHNSGIIKFEPVAVSKLMDKVREELSLFETINAAIVN